MEEISRNVIFSNTIHTEVKIPVYRYKLLNILNFERDGFGLQRTIIHILLIRKPYSYLSGKGFSNRHLEIYKAEIEKDLELTSYLLM